MFLGASVIEFSSLEVEIVARAGDWMPTPAFQKHGIFRLVGLLITCRKIFDTVVVVVVRRGEASASLRATKEGLSRERDRLPRPLR